MELEDIKQLVNSAESATETTREESSDMLFFGRISQWDDNVSSSVQLEYRGQFDLIKPKRNAILSELWSNPVSIQFKPQDGAEDDAADTLNGMFRRCMQLGEEAVETATQDQVDGGFGAFRFVTEYVSKKDNLDNTQRIIPKPINEANNRVYWDANAKTKDKSDARWCLLISTFTKNGWEGYCSENGISHSANEEPDSFKTPNTTNSWFFNGSKDEVKVGEFYHREKKRERVLLFESPLGEQVSYLQKEIKSVIDELEEDGFIKVGEKMRDAWVVTKCLVSGSKIIKKQRIAGEYIPIVPFYGDWSFMEGREIWRGIYHDAQDPQRLHNFLMSYTADIVTQGPRQKPMFYPGQIKGFEYMYTQNGADDNYPYKLVNEQSSVTGLPYPTGPVSYLEPPQMPQAQAALMQYTRQAVDDVTGTSMNSDQMMNSQVTEGQIAAAQKSNNMETFLYQNSQALAMKQAGRIFASMAAEIMDVPQEIMITAEDGSESSVSIRETILDYETGKEVTLNDLSKGTYEVYADTGPSYSSQRDQAKAEMAELYKNAQGTQEGQIALLTYLTLQEGPGYEDIRKYARKQLIMQGIKEPDTDEEKQMMQDMSQQQQQPDANMMLAMAEQAKADADMAKVQADQQSSMAKVQVDAFNAETKRIDVMASNKLKQVDAAKKASEIQGNELDNVQKLAQAFMPRGQMMQ